MFNFFKAKTDRSKEISVEEFERLMDLDDHILLDVRSPEELDAGMIPGSIMINYFKVGFKNELSKLDKSKAYLVYCLSGPRSAKTTKMMSSMGFERIYHLKDGIVAWQSKRRSKPS